jgi:ubiquinone/menaquinone biosynthesis C-methylase UbiE
MKRDATGQTIRTLLSQVDLRGKRILEVGCGDGNTTRDLACQADPGRGRVVAVDPDLAAVKQARANCPEASFLICGGEALPFCDSSFDLVIFSYSLHHIPIPLMDSALKEAARAVRPGGQIVAIEPVGRGSFVEAWRILGGYEDEERHAAQEALRKLEGWQVAEEVFFQVVFELEDVGELCQRVCGRVPEKVPEELAEFLEQHRVGGRMVLEAERRMTVMRRKAMR